MGIVDTMRVGRVSAEAIGAVSLGGVLFYAVAMFGSGLMLGLDTLVSRSCGARRLMDCHHSLVSAVHLSLPLAAVLMLLIWCWIPLLQRFGINPSVMRQTVPYLMAILWSTFPLILALAKMYCYARLGANHNSDRRVCPLTRTTMAECDPGDGLSFFRKRCPVIPNTVLRYERQLEVSRQASESE